MKLSFHGADRDVTGSCHLDHCGRIPLLVKRGFQGEIITTAATVELARLVMLGFGRSSGRGGTLPVG